MTHEIKREMKRLRDSYYHHVHLEDGVPVSYSQIGSPASRDEEPDLLKAIQELTGQRFRFGKWVQQYGDPRDSGSDVPLLPLLSDGWHQLPDEVGSQVYVERGRPTRFACLGDPHGAAQQPVTGERIQALTGFRVKFGTWRETPQSVREGGAEVDLIAEE